MKVSCLPTVFVFPEFVFVVYAISDFFVLSLCLFYDFFQYMSSCFLYLLEFFSSFLSFLAFFFAFPLRACNQRRMRRSSAILQISQLSIDSSQFSHTNTHTSVIKTGRTLAELFILTDCNGRRYLFGVVLGIYLELWNYVLK